MFWSVCLPWVSIREILQRQFQNSTSNCIHPEIKCQVTLVWIHHGGVVAMLPALYPFCTTLFQGSEVPAGRKEAVNKQFPRKSLFLTLKECQNGEVCKEKGPKCDLKATTVSQKLLPHTKLPAVGKFVWWFTAAKPGICALTISG